MNHTTHYLLGHRGARGECLENTAIGFAFTQSLAGLDGVEFDIQMTHDGQFVVVHDADLERLGQRAGLVSQLSLQALQSIPQTDYGRGQGYQASFTGHPILSLSLLPPYLTGYRHIEFEIKTHQASCPVTLVQNLLMMVSSPAWQDLPITFTSFDTDVLLQLLLQQTKPDYQGKRFPTGLLLEPIATLPTHIQFCPTLDAKGDMLIYTSFNRACALGCHQVGIYYPLISPRLMAIARRFDLAVTAWTVNEVSTIKRLYDMGVKTVITDYPQQVLSQLS